MSDNGALNAKIDVLIKEQAQIKAMVDILILSVDKLFNGRNVPVRVSRSDDLTDTELLDIIMLTAERLLKLSKPLQATVLAVRGLGGEGTAQQVSERTNKKRPVESALLNELVRLGYICKSRRGRHVFFMLPKISMDNMATLL